MTEVKNASQIQNNTNKSFSKKRNIRYVHYTILFILVISSFMGKSCLWGVYFLIQLIPAYIHRSVFFIDMISRDEEPKFYWLVFVIWILFGVLMIMQDIPSLAVYLK